MSRRCADSSTKHSVVPQPRPRCNAGPSRSRRSPRDAPLAEERPTTLVFAPEFLALLVHESCGHPTEADRLLEHEVAFAGTTFMWPEDRGKLRYGSRHVSMTADATVPGGLGTFGWDDDGVPAMRTKLVDKGIFVGYLTSRETAGALGVPIAIGSARAEG